MHRRSCFPARGSPPAEQVAQTLGQIEKTLHALDGKREACRLI
ncbi:hypothetical protein [Ktedonobacter sp. SOSP1-52]|nr:hypothetical protein [Ktedonobacter sp. SOSP1-52]